MRVLGIDYGDKRIGIAISDPYMNIASPIKTITYKGDEKTIDEIMEIIKEYEIEKIVLGMPKNMNNTVGERGEKSIAFSKILSERSLKQVILWDERL